MIPNASYLNEDLYHFDFYSIHQWISNLSISIIEQDVKHNKEIWDNNIFKIRQTIESL